MKHCIFLFLMWSWLLPTAAISSGFRIPNQSVTAVGIAGAHIAHTEGPDASYYNPANMAFLEDQWHTETSLTALSLPSITYTDNRTARFNGSSDSELFLLPQLHLVSNLIGKLRFGFSLTYPFGLAKSWEQVYPAMTAREFSLFVVEANPTLSFSLTDSIAFGGGLRVVHGTGEVKNLAANPPLSGLAPLTSLSRDLEGDDTGIGYNLALTLRPTNQWSLAATYRSEVTLDLDGEAILQALAGPLPLAVYDGPASLDITLPAVLSLAAAYTIGDLTLELAWDRTFWSSFEALDFQYQSSLLHSPFDGFDRSMPRNWDDSDAIRFGLTYLWGKRLTTTLGFAIDYTPVPESTLGFELPDSDAFMYAAGLQYHCMAGLTIAGSYMYHHTTSRTVRNNDNSGLPGIDGTFSDGGAHAVTLGVLFNF